MDFLNTPEKLNRRLVHNPMGRFGEAVEQAKAVVFCECHCCSLLASPMIGGSKLTSAVASDDSSYINGTDFLVDGGLHACYVVSDDAQRRSSDPARTLSLITPTIDTRRGASSTAAHRIGAHTRSLSRYDGPSIRRSIV